MRRFRVLLGVTLATLLALSGCNSLSPNTEPPEVHLSSVALLGITMLEQEWELTLRLRNPNEYPLTLRSVDYQIFIGDKPFARGLSQPDTDIPAMGNALIKTRVTTGLFATLKQLQALDYQPGEQLQYRIEGKARVGNLPFPLTFNHKGAVAFPDL